MIAIIRRLYRIVTGRCRTCGHTEDDHLHWVPFSSKRPCVVCGCERFR